MAQWISRAVVLDVAAAAIRLVLVVPMFAPKVMGNILLTDSTPMPTNGVSAEVVIELDWTAIVTSTPTIIAK